MPKLTPYKKDSDYSYSLGLFPTLELLTAKPQIAQRVLISSKVKDSTGLQKIRELCTKHNVIIEEIDHHHIERLAKSENCFAVGIFKKTDEPLNPKASHVVLVTPDDMGNLGTIMRTCLGFGVQDLAIITPAADAYDPKTIRASMGATFQLHTAHFASFDDYKVAFPSHATYTFVLDGQQKLADVDFTEPCSLVFGPEGAGLPPAIAAQGTSVSIEQTAAVDSLNLALAVGVVLYKRYVASV